MSVASARLTQKKDGMPFKRADKIKNWAHENLMEFIKAECTLARAMP